MSIFSGITNVVNPANILLAASGPAGWATIAARSLMASVGQAVIQGLAEKLGLPQTTIDLAQGAFSGSIGDFQGAAQNLSDAASGFAAAAGGSPAEQGDFSREVDDAVNQLVSQLADGDDAKAARCGGKGGGGSWLMALAEALGHKLDKMANEMSNMADQITDKTPSATAKFGAKTQEFSILMNAATNAIKTVGEAEANTARKG
ncbi:hypothetical protein U1872_03710 [Sphingomonas sp. RB3P16]|uniref:hypothetical protein n=1 Tax=Parasphingomonas frigoris TaxID=3096163 RepID=UPI002FC93F05